MTVKKRHHRLLRAIAAGLMLAAPLAAPMATAQEKVVVKVNGKNLTESDLKYAEAEIGADIGNLPEATRRQIGRASCRERV